MMKNKFCAEVNISIREQVAKEIFYTSIFDAVLTLSAISIGFTLRPIIFTDLEVTFARLHILFVEIVCFAFAFYRISCSLSKILKIVDTAHLEVDKL